MAVRLIGVIPLLIAGLAACVLLIRGGLPKLSTNILRMQRISTVQELEGLVGDVGDRRRDKERAQLKADFAFIAFYLALFVTLAILLAYRDGAWATVLSIAAATTATAAALSDVSENLLTFRVLRTPLEETTNGMLTSMRTATTVKWGLVAATLALLSGLFWGDRPGVDIAFGVLWAIAATVGILATARPNVLPYFFALDAVSLAATVAFFAGSPPCLLNGF